MAIDDRFDLARRFEFLVTGWQKAEYDQMGIWPGDEHFQASLRGARRVAHP